MPTNHLQHYPISCVFFKDGVLPKLFFVWNPPIPYQDGDWLNHNENKEKVVTMVTRICESSLEH